MSNHTPGPWRFDKDAGHPPCRFINADRFDDIAILRGGHDWEVQDANAKLIAAAPEVLLGEEEITQRHITDASSYGSERSGGVPLVGAVAVDAAPPADSLKSAKVEPTAPFEANGEVIDAEFVTVDERMGVPLDGPSTDLQKKTIVELMKSLHHAGMTDITAKIKAKLAKHSLATVSELTVIEADQLIEALQTKELLVWIETSMLQGHAKK